MKKEVKNLDKAKVKILLVDDVSWDSEIVTKLLMRRYGYGPIVVANDGLEALEKIKKNNFDLVLMDVFMPRMDGFTAIQAIRQNDEHKNLPIIVIMASAFNGHRRQAEEAGADYFMPKPLDFALLDAKMEELLTKEDTPSA